MSKSIFINFGNGNLANGFSTITVQFKEPGKPHSQSVGSLSPGADLLELYTEFRDSYDSFYKGMDKYSLFNDDDDDDFEFDQAGHTNFSEVKELLISSATELKERMNDWLNYDKFAQLLKDLRTELDSEDEIEIIIETKDDTLRRLPWHDWKFLNDYPLAEIALSPIKYRNPSSLNVRRSQVRILLILGSSKDSEGETNINVGEFRKYLAEFHHDANIHFLDKPFPKEFNDALRDKDGWDILLFAGHSGTTTDGEREKGIIHINDNETDNSITVASLKKSLENAIKQDLRLAIFNSCDGLGIANDLAELNIPQVIVMREPVPQLVALEFFKHFLKVFVREKKSLYLATQQARKNLEALEAEVRDNYFPCASWLPMICHNPAVESSTWAKLGGAPCPYKGLEAFEENDAQFFFGRKTFIEQLASDVRNKPLVAVVGASGSGKSSVVRAGLIPSLKQSGNWQIVYCRPDREPFDSLATAFIGEPDKNKEAIEQLSKQFQQKLDSLQATIKKITQKKYGRLLLVIDQFEELYTSDLDKKQRNLFLDLLSEAIKQSDRRFTLLITLRSDFYGYVLEYDPLSNLFHEGYQRLEPMKREALEEVITRPAIEQGLQFEERLAQRLIDDTMGVVELEDKVKSENGSDSQSDSQSANSLLPSNGNLPLLQFTLKNLWEKQQYGYLTHKGYEEIGSVEESLGNYADEVYKKLIDVEKVSPRTIESIFIQLVSPALEESKQDTRRLATRTEIEVVDNNWDLVTKLASKRLVVTGRNEKTKEETVEIVHEALIDGWEKLPEWMDRNREFRSWQEELRLAMRQWENQDQDKGGLLRGAFLVKAKDWLEKKSEVISLPEQSFIEQSLKLEHRNKLTAIGALGVSLILLTGFSGWALVERQNFQIKAGVSSIKALNDSNKYFDALVEGIRTGRQLQQPWGRFVTKENQTEFSATMLSTLNQVRERNRLTDPSISMVDSIDISSDGIIATASGALIKLWHLDGSLSKEFNISDKDTQYQKIAPIIGVSFTPDGQTLFSLEANGILRIWDVAKGELLESIYNINSSTSWLKSGRAITVSHDGRAIALPMQFDRQTVKDANGKELKILTKAETTTPSNISLSPDGNLIATVGYIRSSVGYSRSSFPSLNSDEITAVQIWNRYGRLRRELTARKDNGSYFNLANVSFSPDGSIIAASGTDGVVFWNRYGREIAKVEAKFNAETNRTTIVFNSDNKTVATGSSNGLVELWAINNKGSQSASLITSLTGHSGAITDLAFSPDGQTLVSSSFDSTVKLWDLEGSDLETTTIETPVHSFAFSPDSQTIASVKEEEIKLYSLNGEQLKVFPKANSSSLFLLNTVDFSPDGKHIAINLDKTIEIRNLEGQLVKILKPEPSKFLPEHLPQYFLRNFGSDEKMQVSAASISPDGRTIATANMKGGVNLWANTSVWQDTILTPPATNLTFSSDGKKLAVATIMQPLPPLNFKYLIDRNLTFASARVVKSATELNITAQYPQYPIQVLDPSECNLPSLGEEVNCAVSNTIKLRGHKNQIRGLAFSPDGKTIASASLDDTVRLWNSETGENIKILEGYTSDIYDLRFSPDGQILATAGQDGIWLWDASGNLIRKMGEKFESSGIGVGIDFNKETKTLQITRVYNDTLAMKAGLQVGDLIVSIDGELTSKMSADEAYKKVAGDADTQVTLEIARQGVDNWQTSITRKKYDYFQFYSSVDFTPDGKQLVASGASQLYLLNLDGKKIKTLRNLETTFSNYQVRFSPDGKIIVSNSHSDGTIQIWSRRGKELKTIKAHEDIIFNISFSPDGKTFTTSSADGTAKVWNYRGKQVQTLDPRIGLAELINKRHQLDPNLQKLIKMTKLTEVKYSPDGKLIAAINERGEVKFWDNNGTFKNTITDGFWRYKAGLGHFTNLDFSPNSENIVLTESDGKTVKVFRVEDGKLLTKLESKGKVNSVNFSPDGKLIAIAGEDTDVRIWDWQNRKELPPLIGHRETIRKVKFSPDGYFIATASEDNTVKLWDREGLELATFNLNQAVYDVNFSPDGKILAASTLDKIAFWNLDIDNQLGNLLSQSCDFLRDYFNNNTTLPTRDSRLCDGIKPAAALSTTLAKSRDTNSVTESSADTVPTDIDSPPVTVNSDSVPDESSLETQQQERLLALAKEKELVDSLYKLAELSSVKRKLAAKTRNIPVYLVTNEFSYPALKKPLGLFDGNPKLYGFFTELDAYSSLELFSSTEPQLIPKLRVSVVSLGEIYEKLLRENSQFSYLTVFNTKQLKLAQAIKIKQDKAFYGNGGALFIATIGEDNHLLTIKKDGKEIIPLFLAKEDLETALKEYQQQNSKFSKNVKIDAINWTDLIGIVHDTDDDSLIDVTIIPPKESHNDWEDLSSSTPINILTENYSPSEKVTTTDLEALVNSALGQKDDLLFAQRRAIDLVKKYLKAKKSMYGSSYNRNTVSKIATGEFYNKIISSINWLEDNNKYYKYDLQKIQSVEDFVLKDNKAQITVKVTEDYTLYNEDGSIDYDKSALKTLRVIYDLEQITYANWKISASRIVE